MPWKRTTIWKRRTEAALRARDGDGCWLCTRPIDVGLASIEHVLPRSLGGNDALDNLRLCHRDCNTRLGNRTPKGKRRMRQRVRRGVRKALRIALAKSGLSFTGPHA